MWDSIKDFLKPEVVWFLVGLVLLILEFAMPGLIIFFFGVGACVVAIVCLITEIDLNVQLIIFIASSVLSLLVLRKWLKGIFTGRLGSDKDASGDLKEFIGERAVVTEPITPEMGGRVEVHGTTWKAKADEKIAAGAVVEITGKENITLRVKPL